MSVSEHTENVMADMPEAMLLIETDHCYWPAVRQVQEWGRLGSGSQGQRGEN